MRPQRGSPGLTASVYEARFSNIKINVKVFFYEECSM
jgi:hypothetical protein